MKDQTIHPRIHGVSGPKYGMERYLYQFISELYPENIEYDIDKIKMWSLDIETSSENGSKNWLGRSSVDVMKNFKQRNSSPLFTSLQCEEG